MMKVRILDRCEFCDDETNLIIFQNADSHYMTYDRNWYC